MSTLTREKPEVVGLHVENEVIEARRVVAVNMPGGGAVFVMIK